MAVFEIPTGVVADTVGRRLSFLLSIVIVLTGTLGYVGVSAVGGGLVLFCAMSVLLGLGYAFYSVAMEAWLVDALRATGFDGQLDRVFARSSMVSGTAMLFGTVGGGLLASVDLAWPFLLRSGLLLIVFSIAFLTMRDLGFRRRPLSLSAFPAEMRLVTKTSVVYGWQRASVRLLMITSFFQWGFCRGASTPGSPTFWTCSAAMRRGWRD